MKRWDKIITGCNFWLARLFYNSMWSPPPCLADNGWCLSPGWWCLWDPSEHNWHQWFHPLHSAPSLANSKSGVDQRLHTCWCFALKVAFFPPCDLKEKTPRRTIISRGRLTWSSEDSLCEDLDQASTPKKRRLTRMNSQEEMTARIRSDNREGQEKKK